MKGDPFTWLLGGLWALAAAGLSWYCLSAAQQITYVTLADGRRQERRLPLAFRLLLPLAPNVAPVFASAPWRRVRERIDKRIVSAGFEGLLSAAEYLALRLLLPVTLGAFWLLLIYTLLRAVNNANLHKLGPALYAFGPVWLWLYPALWLKGAVETRHRGMRRALPFVLDVLTLSVEAGMDFMTALRRQISERPVDAMGEELIRVVREIQLGKTRRVALRDMSLRVNMADLRSVINALVQADELGVSIGAILRIQADQIRQRRFERAEKLANEAPVKMLAPLMLFIFPAVFLVLLGPVLMRVIEQGF